MNRYVPQAIYFALLLFSLRHAWKIGRAEFRQRVVAHVVVTALLWWGGFFG